VPDSPALSVGLTVQGAFLPGFITQLKASRILKLRPSPLRNEGRGDEVECEMVKLLEVDYL